MLIIATFGDMEIVVVLKVSWIINIQILFICIEKRYISILEVIYFFNKSEYIFAKMEINFCYTFNIYIL